MNLKERATLVAKTFKVRTERDRAAVVTEGYKQAHPYEWENELRKKVKFEDTPCYKELVKLGLYVSKEISKAEADEIFLIARKRFWRAVCGNVTALIPETTVDEHWLAVDLPLILANTAIRQINGENKFEFAKKYSA